jgi:hypothetical protein
MLEESLADALYDPTVDLAFEQLVEDACENPRNRSSERRNVASCRISSSAISP